MADVPCQHPRHGRPHLVRMPLMLFQRTARAMGFRSAGRSRSCSMNCACCTSFMSSLKLRDSLLMIMGPQRYEVSHILFSHELMLYNKRCSG